MKSLCFCQLVFGIANIADVVVELLAHCGQLLCLVAHKFLLGYRFRKFDELRVGIVDAVDVTAP